MVVAAAGALTVASTEALTATAMAAAGTATVDSNDEDNDGSGGGKSDNVTAVAATQRRWQRRLWQ